MIDVKPEKYLLDMFSVEIVEMGVNRTSPDQYQLRFPEGLRDELKEAAAKRGRSLNAEIIARITEHEKLLEFWGSADSQIAKLEQEAEDAAALRKENEELRLKVAYQEGMVASLRAHLDIFIQHLAQPGSGQKEVLDRIIADIKAIQTPQGEPN